MVSLKSAARAGAMSAPTMVEKWLRGRGIADERVLMAMAKVPRHEFVPEALRARAYSDHPLPIGEDQTISQPYIVARMTEALKLTGKERILEIGTGSGYQTAILAELAAQVFSVERHHRLGTTARSRLEELGYHNVSIRIANGAMGWSEYAPYDRIIITASAVEVPEPLCQQLVENGIMVAPLGTTDRAQELLAFRKTSQGWENTFLCHCTFVPFVE